MKTNNINYYELSPDNFINHVLAKRAGIIDGKDASLIFTYIENRKNISIVEYGAGEGRIIDKLIKSNFYGNIIGIEASESKYKALFDKYHTLKNITIYNSDISNYIKNHDYAILGFSILMEINKRKQRKIIRKLATSIQKKIFIDLPLYLNVTNGTYISNKHLVLKESWGKVDGYFPSKLEIIQCLRHTPFFLEEKIIYACSNNKKRELYVLTRRTS